MVASGIRTAGHSFGGNYFSPCQLNVREPVTTDKRVSYVNAHNQLVAYDVPMKCALCRKCLGDRAGRCMYGGPFAASTSSIRSLKEG